MRHFILTGLLTGSLAIALLAQAASAQQDVKKDGVFGFPQKDAKVVCDTPELRVSAWNDAAYLYVQAILLTDNDDAPGQTPDGRPIGDNSDLIVDTDGNGSITDKVDRSYSLNPWPTLPGLHYSILYGGGMSSHLMSDSKGRGAISYVKDAAGKTVRVDSYLIPLEEIKSKAGSTVRFGYYGWSPSPNLTLNSVGYKSDKHYYSFSLPWKDFNELKLADGHRPAESALDVTLVPEGRAQVPANVVATKPMPKVGEVPPEVKAVAWLNWKTTTAVLPTLASLKGKVIIVEFWATWCGPCVQVGIPHLNDIFDKHKDDPNLVILALTDQANPDYIRDFMKTHPMHYPVGVGSESGKEYGVTAIPQAFIIGRDGRISWEGNPTDYAFKKALDQALEIKH